MERESADDSSNIMFAKDVLYTVTHEGTSQV